MKIIEINKDIKRLVDENDGYCPCTVVKNDDTKCICKEFKEQKHPGACHCGRFEKVVAEKEYIERGALIAEYDRVHVGAPGGARKLMVDAPAADVVEVVRCKNCEYCRMSYDPKTKISVQVCGYVGFNPVQSSQVSDNDYCSHGERKEQT